jgi:hypothetical protein
MRITGLLATATAAALLAGCGIGAPAYPQFGQVAYRMEGSTASLDASSAATHTVIYRDGPKMRVEATLPQYGQAAIVFDQATGAAYVLNPTTGAINTAADLSAATSNPAAPAPVAGVAVRIADADAPQPLENAWDVLGADNAKSAGRCEVAGESGREWQPRESTAGVERTACITDDGIVLRVTENGRALWQATSLQRGQQEAALFGVPAGYQLIDPQAVAAQVSEQMQQLDSVTGAAPLPAAPPPG